MSIFKELEKHLTFSHPKLEIREEILKNIKHTKKWDKKKKEIAKKIKIENKNLAKTDQKLEKPQKPKKINDIITELNKVAPKKKGGLVSLRYKQAKIKDSIELPKKREAPDA